MTGNAAPCSKLKRSGSGKAWFSGTVDHRGLPAEAGARPITRSPALNDVDAVTHGLDLAGDLVAEDAGGFGASG